MEDIHSTSTIASIASIVIAMLAGSAAVAVPVETDPELASPPRLELELSENSLLRAPSMTLSAPADAVLQEALRLLQAGNIAESIAMTRQYLAATPGSAAAHELLGASLIIQGKVDEGYAELRRAVQVDPRQSSAYVKIGDVLMTRGDVAGAKRSYETAVGLDPSDRLSQQRLGLIAEREGDTARAIEYYERGIIGTPAGYVGVRTNLARLYNGRGEYGKARAVLQAPLGQRTTDANAHVVLGTSLLGLGRVDEAIGQFEFAVQIDPRFVGGQLGLGIASRGKRDFAKSLRALNEVVRLEPKWSTGHFQVGETYLAMGRPTEAVIHYERALPLSPDPRLIRRRIADAHAAAGEYGKAIPIYESLAQAADAGPAVLAALGSAYQLNGDVARARATFERNVAERPKDPGAYLLLGNHFGFMRDYRSAISAYEDGLRIAPRHAPLLNAQALAYSRAGQPAKAASVAQRLVEASPGNIEAEFLLASLRDEAGQQDAAATDYRGILAREPDHVGANNNLAMILSRQGRNEEALRFARRAREGAPTNPMVLDTNGLVELNAGRVGEAVVTLQEAVRLAPLEPTVHYRLGAAQLKSGNRVAAAASLRKALELNPSFPEAREARALLEGL